MANVPWKELANLTDDAIVDHFMTIRGHDEKHARNSLRFLRMKLGHGNGTAPQPKPAPVIAHPQPATLPVYTPPKTPQPVATAPVAAPNDGMAGLAAMLAPHLAGMIGGDLVHSVAIKLDTMQRHFEEQFAAKLEALKTPPAVLVVIEPKSEPRALEGVHHEMAPKLIRLAAQGLNVMMVGPAGCGKTVLAKSVAQAQNKKLTVISCSAGMSEAQLLGRLLPLGANGSFVYVESPFMKAYREGGVILLDEMDAADANLLLVINAALANGGIEIEARAASNLDTHVAKHPECVILAAANTWGGGADTQYVGRGALDVSTLDRFYRVAVDYDAKLEFAIGEAITVERVHSIRKAAQAAKLRRVVSTRMIVRVDSAVRAGLSLNEAFSDELASWTIDERRKAGEG